MLLFGTLALAACNSGGGQPGFYGAAGFAGGTGASFPAPSGRMVAILLPLSGPNAALGDAMLKAAKLALDAPGAPPLQSFDTGGTAGGAQAAAKQALAGGAGLILGPLTAAETAAVAPLAQQAGVGVLAFTSDPTQAQPGVWTLGITPAQQVRRLVAAAQAQGRTRIAGLMPDNAFGAAMGKALTESCASIGLPPPTVRTYSGSFNEMNQVVRDLSDYANRRGPIDAQIRAARALGTPEGRRRAAELARSAIPPAPFDALLVADTGERLAEILSLLPYYDIDQPKVQLLGPTLWAASAAQLGNQRGMSGAWYAAPDPAARAAFADRFQQAYGAPPPALADLAFDAAGIARVTAGNWSAGSLTRADGFAGTDGILALRPDGTVRRGLAIFALQRGGPQMVEPAPQTLAPAGV